MWFTWRWSNLGNGRGWNLWGQRAIIHLKNESHSLASDISPVLEGPPAEEPAVLTEHGASTSSSDRKPFTAGRTAWFFLGIDVKESTTALLASVCAFLWQMACGTSLCCRMVSDIRLLVIPLQQKPTSFLLIWSPRVEILPGQSPT